VLYLQETIHAQLMFNHSCGCQERAFWFHTWYHQKSSSAVVAILDIGNPHKNSNFVREHPMTISVQI